MKVVTDSAHTSVRRIARDRKILDWGGGVGRWIKHKELTRVICWVILPQTYKRRGAWSKPIPLDATNQTGRSGECITGGACDAKRPGAVQYWQKRAPPK